MYNLLNSIFKCDSSRSVVSVRNQMGEKAFVQLTKIVSRSPDLQNSRLQELNINESLLLSKSNMIMLMEALSNSCKGQLRRLGLSYHFIDEPSSLKLKEFLEQSQSLKKLDISSTKFSNFNSFIEVINGLANENKSLQYLNIGGMTFTRE
jgi:hypothetical protein